MRAARLGPSLSIPALERIVQQYEREKRAKASAELDTIARFKSLDDAIEWAALAKSAEGKRASHQRRIPPESLKIAATALKARRKEIAAATSFVKLLAILERVVDQVPGVGALYAYDTALRIGAFLRVQPQLVYLHAGTAEGAKALGFDGKRRSLRIDELPTPFHRLSAWEIENCLCIFKGRLAGDADHRSSSCEPRSRRLARC